MEAILTDIINNIQLFVETSNIFFSIAVGVLIIITESIIPILPLSVFIAINVIAFGPVGGFITSFIGTMIGCTLSYFLFNKLRLFVYKKLYKHTNLINFINKINDIKFSNLVLILAMPFTPAFTINIAAGLSEMKYKKYFLALLCSKIFIVYFWAFIATTFLESITDVTVIIKIAILILGAYILSKVVTKKFNI